MYILGNEISRAKLFPDYQPYMHHYLHAIALEMTILAFGNSSSYDLYIFNEKHIKSRNVRATKPTSVCRSCHAVVQDPKTQ